MWNLLERGATGRALRLQLRGGILIAHEFTARMAAYDGNGLSSSAARAIISTSE
jgi:hypothetical protein